MHVLSYVRDSLSDTQRLTERHWELETSQILANHVLEQSQYRLAILRPVVWEVISLFSVVRKVLPLA